MSGHQRHRLLPLVAAISLGLMPVGVSAAVAHQHPTPIERAAPAVVFIEARARVEVALIEHHTGPEKRAVHISIVQSTWNPLLDTASGFFVDPNGTIVTTGGLLTPKFGDAEVFAVNQAFAKQYGTQAPLPSNPYSRHHVGKGANTIDQRLQACYPPHTVPNDAGGCVIRTTTVYTVHPYVTDQRRYGDLPAEADTKNSTKDVGLLRVRSNNLPTVTVAAPSPTETALAVLGFTDIPGPNGDHKQKVINQHFAEPGGPLLKSAKLDAAESAGSAMLRKELGRGIEGGPVVAGGGKATSGGQVVGLIPGPAAPGQAVPTLVTADAILQVLKSATVAPRPSQTDTDFEAAMHHFKNKEYAASIPFLENTLKQFRGHALAAEDLAFAKEQVKKGVGGPRTMAPMVTGGASGAANSSVTRPLTIGLVAAAFAALVAAVLVFRRRRLREGEVSNPAATPSAKAPGPLAAPSGGQAGGSPQQQAPPRGRGGAGAIPDAAVAASRVGRSAAAGAAAPSHTATSRVTPRPASGRGPAPSTAHPQPQSGRTPSPPTTVTPPAATAPVRNGTAFCTSCGGRLSAGHRFCGRCGAPVG
jgi:hypothetical protein